MGQTVSTKPQTHVTSSFPLTPNGCTKQSESLFSCLESASSAHLSQTLSSSPGSSSVDASQIEVCSLAIAAYNNCVDTNIDKASNKKFKRVQERVPEEYRFARKVS
jgi:hypothetical protein